MLRLQVNSRNCEMGIRSIGGDKDVTYYNCIYSSRRDIFA
jgi:hypothetical protein